MKKLLLILSLAILGCSLPVQLQLTSGTPTPSPAPTQTPTPAPTPLPTSEPGTKTNPLILALAPSPRPDDAVAAAGQVIAAFIEKQTGFTIVIVQNTSESELVEALVKGNAHIASLSPYGYVLARENNSVEAVLASVRNGELFYGTQFIANRESGFTSYFDSARNENTAEAVVALKQFQDKKPCWSDSASPSGYVVPLGLLMQSQVETRSGAFIEGQPSVVRAVYADNICDFGATFIDARQSPVLEADYPDVMDKVHVIWRAPKIIPYENISISNRLPFEMRRVIQRAFIDLMLTPEGKAAVQTVYGLDELQIVEDTAYDSFVLYLQASGLELQDLFKE
ncbi:PhnD/SsuA/transferrin family substrate-binding protein [Candidatus Villigracilis saccharophilus]|uniref:phosphate/phosphite/phosphonate ABC transporter substrate-binding protein n=1 Tax=Candidatus Villigracilis saccharophilus TaxID=3140684 RepID=UPI003134B1A9|nr:PhnD/SsuA/transferrin family substrate-binding protein [Anaerolineales bacterium]